MAFATINYHSQSLRKASSFNIVFPDDPKISRPWSVFYLLHGLSDDHTSWMRRTSIEFGKSPKGGPEDPSAIVVRVDHGRAPALRLDCGTDDFLLEENRSFHHLLESLHIPHEYYEFPGGHNWAYWDMHVQEAVAFHAHNLQLKRAT